MTSHGIRLPLVPLVESEVWNRCSLHTRLSPSGDEVFPCIISIMGIVIRIGNSTAVRKCGAFANRPCHMEVSHIRGIFPLDLVTSPEYYHRSDACLLALADAGAAPRSQAKTKKDRRNLCEKLITFAFRPIASLEALKAVIDMGVGDTDWGRERLVSFATKTFWVHGAPDGREIWIEQDENKYLARQLTVLSLAHLSDEQEARLSSE